MRNYRLCFVKVFVWTLVYVLVRTAAAQPSDGTSRFLPSEEVPGILELIGDEIEDNYRRIITWSGEINVKIDMLHTKAKAEDVFMKLTAGKGEIPAAILQKTEEKVAFSIDSEKEAVYVDNIRGGPCEFVDYATGRNLGISSGPYMSGPYRSTVIGTPEYMLRAESQSFKREDHTIRHSTGIRKPSERKAVNGAGYKGIDDPRKVFMPGGGFTWVHHDRLIKEFEKHGRIQFDGYEFQIEEVKVGDVKEYRLIEPAIISLERSDPDHYVIKSKVFSSQCGFNMVSWKLTSGSGRLLQEFSWEYELVGGVYLPKKVVEKYYNVDGEISLAKNSVYSSHRLDQTIPSNTFEWTNLNLNDGDLFVDEIEGKRFHYERATRTLRPIEKR
jgi:hypothetical protein